MSDLIINPVTIEAIKEHPNADRLEMATVGGWDIIMGKGNYNVGDIVVHIPPDVMVPKDWADKWDVTKYLSWKKEAESGRVRAASLRGYVSFGFLVPNESGAKLGVDLAEHYGITKYDPPQKLGAGSMSNEHPLFHRYTNIQNLRNFKDKLNYDTELVATEKIHGTNSRIGWVRNLEDNSKFDQVIGTHNTQRQLEDCGLYGLPLIQYKESFEEIIKSFMNYRDLDTINSYVFFGEIYGAGIQDLHYGAKQEKGYRVFDIAINGKYLSWNQMVSVCQYFELPTVPLLDQGIFSFEKLLELAEGNTTMDDEHIREGIVVRPANAELSWGRGDRDPNPKRMIFKVISGAYLARKGGSEMH